MESAIQNIDSTNLTGITLYWAVITMTKNFATSPCSAATGFEQHHLNYLYAIALFRNMFVLTNPAGKYNITSF